jgi:steroid 5-alpha reductase family enzyme
MNAMPVLLTGFAASVLYALAVWVRSLLRRDVSVVDSAWPWLILIPALVAALMWGEPSARRMPVLFLAALWALRLSSHILWRHRGQPEDHRYQAIRARNQPNFAFKSVYLVFLLQAVLGFIVSLPLTAAVMRPAPWQALDVVGAALFAFGFLFEAVGDWQLARFKADPANRGKVMDQGLWRYTRHPNYFGEFCLWWGLWLIALATGAWWTVLSPLLMSVLLLKVSGVTLLESNITERRPAYASYIRRTSAFLPRRPLA